MVFSCEVGVTRKGKAKVQRKAILLKKDRLYRKGVWRIPEFLLRYKGQTVLLEGKAPVWDKLRLRSSEGEKTINASDILDLPLPGDAQPGS